MEQTRVCDCHCHLSPGTRHIKACCNMCYELGTILVTGAAGMIGQQLVPLLREKGFTVLTPSKTEMNCLAFGYVCDYFTKNKPDYVIHLAGYNGGISFNDKLPADIYMQNAYMSLNVLAAASTMCHKVVSVLPSCAYSAFDELDEPRSMLFEQDFEKGLPHPSVECHGLAKRILFDYSRQLSKQFKFNAVCCVLNNCYGPGARYNESDRLKVADSLVKKMVDAKYNNQTSVSLWGDGSPRRELIYCEDAAAGIFHVFQTYDNANEVINVGSGEDISILDLALTIKNLVVYEGDIVWNSEMPNGQLKKLFAPYKIQELGWQPSISLVEGLKQTIQWYERKAGYI